MPAAAPEAIVIEENDRYPYLRQLRAWHCLHEEIPKSRTSQSLVTSYLGAMGVKCARLSTMKATDNYLAQLIDKRVVSPANCPELFTKN